VLPASKWVTSPPGGLLPSAPPLLPPPAHREGLLSRRFRVCPLGMRSGGYHDSVQYAWFMGILLSSDFTFAGKHKASPRRDRHRSARLGGVEDTLARSASSARSDAASESSPVFAGGPLFASFEMERREAREGPRQGANAAECSANPLSSSSANAGRDMVC